MWKKQAIKLIFEQKRKRNSIVVQVQISLKFLRKWKQNNCEPRKSNDTADLLKGF